MEAFWLEQAETDLPLGDDWLSAVEAAWLSRLRIPKRRADWKLGRWTAKRAVASFLRLPLDPEVLRQIEVRPAPSGSPELFVADCLAPARISISHRSGLAVCGIAGDGAVLGCDVELIETRDPCFVEDYFTEEEQKLIARWPDAGRPGVVTLLWSAKESALKVLGKGLRLDTRCIAVSIDGQRNQFANDAPCWELLRVACPESSVLRGWWKIDGKLVRTFVSTPDMDPPLQF